MAGLGPDDIDVAQLQDTEAGAEIMHMSENGFCKDGDQEELIQAKYDTNILDQSTKKIQKNYFILLSILFQILSLLSFLCLCPRP
mgnify:CR=1 FL=1